MKKFKFFYVILAVMVLFVSGCSHSYVFSGGFGKHTIEVTAKDGAYGESYDFEVGKDRELAISPDLSGGELQIDFAEATVFMTDTDTPEDVIIGDVVDTVTVSGKDAVSVSLPQGTYVMQVTAKGECKGKVSIEIVKK